LRVDLGVGLVVALLSQIELSGARDVLVELGHEGVELVVVVSLLIVARFPLTSWGGLDDSGGKKSESKRFLHLGY